MAKRKTDFPCYGCERNKANKLPRCVMWKRCRTYRNWCLHSGNIVYGTWLYLTFLLKDYLDNKEKERGE